MREYKYKYTEQDIATVREQYSNNIPLREIAKSINVSPITLNRLMHRHGIILDRNVYSLHCNEDTKLEYENRILSKEYVPYVQTRTFYPPSTWNKYSYNEDYFKNIDTAEKAYIFGLLYADGNISKDGFKLNLTLQEQDYDLLERVRCAMNCSRPLKYVTNNHDSWSNSYSLDINSVRLCDTLIYHGLVPRKSMILKFPINFPNEYYRDFMRGYYDGNGSIRKKVPYALCIVSTDSFCKDARLLIENTLGINCTIRKSCCVPENSVTKELCISGRRQSLIFLKWLYEDSDLYLERKYQVYLQYLDGSLPS